MTGNLAGRRLGVLALASAALAPLGCARDRREITPTTLGTDLNQLPKGKMTPFPWPGQSIVRAKPADRDPAAALASGEAPPR